MWLPFPKLPELSPRSLRADFCLSLWKDPAVSRQSGDCSLCRPLQVTGSAAACLHAEGELPGGAPLAPSWWRSAGITLVREPVWAWEPQPNLSRVARTCRDPSGAGARSQSLPEDLTLELLPGSFCTEYISLDSAPLKGPWSQGSERGWQAAVHGCTGPSGAHRTSIGDDLAGEEVDATTGCCPLRSPHSTPLV